MLVSKWLDTLCKCWMMLLSRLRPVAKGGGCTTLDPSARQVRLDRRGRVLCFCGVGGTLFPRHSPRQGGEDWDHSALFGVKIS